MPWNDVVTMAADVARNGFNVTHDLGRYNVMLKQSLGEVTSTCDTVIKSHQHYSLALV